MPVKFPALSGWLAIGAFTLVLIQAATKFPIERSFVEYKHLLGPVGPQVQLKEGGIISRGMIDEQKDLASLFDNLQYYRVGYSKGFFGFMTAGFLAGLFGIITRRAS